jgi:hypothetical protein
MTVNVATKGCSIQHYSYIVALLYLHRHIRLVACRRQSVGWIVVADKNSFRNETVLETKQ